MANKEEKITIGINMFISAQLFHHHKNHPEEVLIQCTLDYFVIKIKDQKYFWPKKDVQQINEDEETLGFSYRDMNIKVSKKIFLSTQQQKYNFSNSRKKYPIYIIIIFSLFLINFLVIPSIKNILNFIIYNHYFSAPIEDLQFELRKAHHLKHHSIWGKVLLHLGELPHSFELHIINDGKTDSQNIIIPPNIIAINCHFISQLQSAEEFMGQMAHSLAHLKLKHAMDFVGQGNVDITWKMIKNKNFSWDEMQSYFQNLEFNKKEEWEAEVLVRKMYEKNKLNLNGRSDLYKRIYNKRLNSFLPYSELHQFNKKMRELYEGEVFYHPVMFLSRFEWNLLLENCSL